jgi:hypothetical protein
MPINCSVSAGNEMVSPLLDESVDTVCGEADDVVYTWREQCYKFVKMAI